MVGAPVLAMAALATEEQRWAFDLDGYVCYRAPLLADPAAADPDALAADPAILAAIRGLAGGEMVLHHRAAYDGTPGALQETHPIAHVLDREPRWVEPGPDWLTDSSVDERHRLGYDWLSRPDCVCVWGVRVITAPEGGSLTVCACSHKSNVFPPPSMARAEELGATLRVDLAPGDFLLAAAGTLVGVREGRVLELLYADDSRYPAAQRLDSEFPEWHDELTPRQRALMAPTRGMDLDGHALTDDERLAPSLLAANTDPDAPDREEVWFWDLRGYLPVHNVMDKAWLDDCNAVLDSDFAQSQRRSVGIVPELHLDPECSQLIAPAPGTEQPEERVSNTWALPLPYGAPFRRMIDCEPISRR